MPLSFGGALVVAYIAAACGSLLLSSDRRVVLFGGINLAAVVVLVSAGVISLWCVWAAVTSLMIVAHLRRTDLRRHRVRAARAIA